MAETHRRLEADARTHMKNQTVKVYENIRYNKETDVLYFRAKIDQKPVILKVFRKSKYPQAPRELHYYNRLKEFAGKWLEEIVSWIETDTGWLIFKEKLEPLNVLMYCVRALALLFFFATSVCVCRFTG